MNSAAAIIEALNARRPESRMREAARASWGAWLDRLAQRPGHVSGAPVDEVVATLAAREPAAPPPRDVELNRWQAFATLWRQHWQPASSDERRWRWTAGSVSFAWNLLIAILLLVVTALHVVPPRPQDDQEAVQVEYIGRGTPVDEGGGAAPAPAASQAGQSPAAAARAASASTPSASGAPSSPEAASAQQAASPPEAAPQPVVVTTPVSPEPPTFTLPPTTPPALTVEPARAPAPDVRVVPIPTLAQSPTVDVPAPQVELQPRAVATPDVAVREIPVMPRSAPAAPPLSTPVQVERTAAAHAEVQAREIPLSMPSAAPGSAANASTSSSAARPASTPGTAATPGSAAAAGPASSTTAGVGVGPRPAAAPGSWATPRRGDDWGESTRDRPGNSLFDGDGQPRLAEGPGSASAGHPPGMVTQEIKDLDRAGTWLRRKPYAYEPTRWDRFWQPNDNLLQEWVRKGVKEVGIPIPGTNKRIKCVISILQLGGGCFDIEDPNMQDRPATARTPPPVPFKPQLQEGNGATWDKSGTPPPKLPGLFAAPKSGVPPESSATGDASGP